MQGSGEGWKQLLPRTRVVPLGWALRALVPALLVSSLPVSTRGVSYEGGKIGAAMGGLVMFGSILVGWMIYPLLGDVGVVVVFWAFGTAGVVMIINGARPLAFVKPICVKCRLLPVIKEHEALHLSGMEKDSEVWASMRKRYSCESLGLDGDPAICSFCPIPKRLREK